MKLCIIQYYLLAIAFLGCSFADVSANDDMITHYVSNIIQFNCEYPQEKVYLHMDNRSYCIGDTIWFKAYVMNATTLHPTQTSGVLYVELLNENGIEVDCKKLRLVNGMCHGDFVLKDEFRTGYYEVRAYTRNMLNWGNTERGGNGLSYALMSFEEREGHEKEYVHGNSTFIPPYNHCVFSRVFPVFIKPAKKGNFKEEMEFYPLHTKLAFPKETNYEFREPDVKLSFFPEGGSLVIGLPSIVAFEAVDQWGRKIEITGHVTQGNRKRIFEFSTLGRGRGFFSFCPEEGKEYYAHVEYKGKQYRFRLPEAKKEGCVLSVKPPVGKGNAAFRISSAPIMGGDATTLGWTLLCRGDLMAFDTLDISSGEYVDVSLPSTLLRPGVNQLTIFNHRGEILAERMFFVCPSREQAALSLVGLPDTVCSYQPIELKFQTNSSNGYFTQGCFSLSVTDADERGRPSYDARDIRSEMLLSSDVKGFIENVDSYFHHSSERAMTNDIDLLMLVQGWRRYEWQAMSTLRPPRYTAEKGLLLDGYVISDIVVDRPYDDPDSYQRIPNLLMTVSIESPEVSFEDTCLVDSLGRYHLEIDRYFTGEALMTLVLKEKDRTLKKWYQRIIPSDLSLKFSYPVIDRVFSPLPNPYTYYERNSPEDEYLFQIENPEVWDMETTLSEVSIRKRFKGKAEIHFGNPDMVIDYYKEWNHVIDRGCPLLNGSGAFNGENPILLNYHLGRVRLEAGEEQLRKYDSLYIRYYPRYYKPYHMPDTVRVYTNLCSRDNLSVRQLDVETDYRDLTRCVFTYFKRSESPRRAPYMSKNGIRDSYFEGYSRVREFYSPDYSECALPDSADYRRTLYWDPDVWTDHRGRASVTFYNNARTKRLHVRAEGFTRNGEFIVYDSEKDN